MKNTSIGIGKHPRYPNGFYMLSPDGFTLYPGSQKHTSLETAKVAFNTWIQRYKQQGYYSSMSGRIPLDKLWDNMIFNDTPFPFIQK